MASSSSSMPCVKCSLLFPPDSRLRLRGAAAHLRRHRNYRNRWRGEWPREAFAKHGIVYEAAPKAKYDVYRDCCHCSIVADYRSAQFAALECRTARGGRDSLDHPPHSHDDLANAVAVAILVAYATSMTPIDTGPTAEELDSLRAWSRESDFDF
jgi:hypothetical protein